MTTITVKKGKEWKQPGIFRSTSQTSEKAVTKILKILKEQGKAVQVTETEYLEALNRASGGALLAAAGV